MSKINKAIVLLLISIVFAVISLIDLSFGTLSLVMSVFRAPFKWSGEWLLNKADNVNKK